MSWRLCLNPQVMRGGIWAQRWALTQRTFIEGSLREPQRISLKCGRNKHREQNGSAERTEHVRLNPRSRIKSYDVGDENSWTAHTRHKLPSCDNLLSINNQFCACTIDIFQHAPSSQN